MRLLKRFFMPIVCIALAMVMVMSVTACGDVQSDKEFHITFIVDGAEYESRNYKEGELSELPTKGEPYKTGYLFMGWNSAEDGSGIPFTEGVAVTEHMTYYAVFTVDPNPPAPGDTGGNTGNEGTGGTGGNTGNEGTGGTGGSTGNEGTGGTGGSTQVKTFTVKFVTNEGTAVPDETVKENGKITSLNPIRSGYDFDCWCTDSELKHPFDKSTPITDNITLYARWIEKTAQGGNGGGEVTGNTEQSYVVTFKVNDEIVDTQTVVKGAYASEPARPETPGKAFTGWYLPEATSPFKFTTPISESITLEAHFQSIDSKILDIGAYNESLFVIWQEDAPNAATVKYREEGGTEWKSVDKQLIRPNEGSTTEARVDILGLKAGSYEVQITTNGTTITTPAIAVSAYDRSGYAHFNYTGVGAYNDDGTLKDNALVIYVTEENKDTVMKEVCEANPDVEMFRIPYCTTASHGKNWNKDAEGIGWWLNNNQYTASNANSNSAKTPSNTYDAVNGGKLGFKSVDRPIVVRIIGEVTTPEGLSAYDSEEEGGLPGDNGHMARMKNLKNITIEGVGEDAMIRGWGLHFIAGTDAQNGQGTSFEVRNLTFFEYPEDAIGMEGQQSGSKITASVERCWVHNNTFLPGHCENPAESDKAEGDGSCDFKRGMYFTLSYNWFEYCHKTNLVGSSDSSLQYNLTFHHNVWWQCGSRIPLTRQANVHFYNNFVYGDPGEKSTPYSWISKPAPSYVHSLRANCYIFSESNYYEGCKNVTDGKNGGAAKGWNNVIYADYGGNTITVAKSREEKVPNSCAYDGTNYSTFDTDESLFYYDATNKVSKCLLDDAVSARRKCLSSAGANGHGIYDTSFNQNTVSGDVSEGEVTMGSSTQGITFNDVSKDGKFRGQGITFKIASTMSLTITTTSTGDAAPELLNSEGLVWAHKFTGTITIVLPAGTYIIASGQKDKDCVVKSMKFEDTAESGQQRVQAAKDAINKLPAEAQLTSDYETLLTEAQNAFNALTAEEKNDFDKDLITKLQFAADQYSRLQMEEVQRLINDIGQVTKDSYDKLNAAQTAYDKLNATQKGQLEAYREILDAAWAAYETFAVQNVIDMITAFKAKVDAVDSSTPRATIEALIDEGEGILDAYNNLSEDVVNGTTQKQQVTNYNDLTDSIDKLDKLFAIYDFRDKLAYFEGHTVVMADSGKVNELNSLYGQLDQTQINALSNEEKELYNSVKEAYEELTSQTIETDFVDGKASNSVFTVSGNKKSTEFTIKGLNKTLASGLKMESATKVTFTTTVKMTLTLYVDATGKKFKIDGADKDHYIASTTNSDGDYVVTVTLEAGTHTIEKGDSVNLYYATLIPA